MSETNLKINEYSSNNNSTTCCHVEGLYFEVSSTCISSDSESVDLWVATVTSNIGQNDQTTYDELKDVLVSTGVFSQFVYVSNTSLLVNLPKECKIHTASDVTNYIIGSLIKSNNFNVIIF